MKIRRTIEEVVEHGEKIVIENIKIAGKEYKLKIMETKEVKSLSFQFFDKNSNLDCMEEYPEFQITIHAKGEIGFMRYCHRNHDHDDIETLQINEKGEIKWRSRYPYKGEGYKFFKILFGSIKKNY